MMVGSGWRGGGEGIRLGKKLLLHPGGRLELDSGDSERSDSSQMNSGENHETKHCTRAIRLSGTEGGQAPDRLCVCFRGLAVATVSF